MFGVYIASGDLELYGEFVSKVTTVVFLHQQNVPY